MESPDRRTLLRGAAAFWAAALLPPGALAAPLRLLVAPREREGPNLVLLQLSGGNDALSTVVPYADDAYHRLRPRARIDAREVLRIDDSRGFHPALVRLRAHYDAGRVALVEGVGYPSPSRSHFRSLEVWHAADPAGRSAGDGWVGRLCAAAFGEASPTRVVHAGGDLPYSLRSSAHPPASAAGATDLRWMGTAGAVERYAAGGPPPSSATHGRLVETLRDALDSTAALRAAVARHRPAAPWPGDELARSLRTAAACIHGGIGCRVASVETSGFDTHSDQRRRHDGLMARLDRALDALLEDLESSEAGRRTLVLVFSEFGRRVRENSSRGTDHGKAGLALVAGPRVMGGLEGAPPSLEGLDQGDLPFTTDFRSLYATVIERGFGVPHERVLGARFPLLGFV